jgi:hypothetical protein
LADSHTNSTEKEKVAAAPLLDEIKTREGGGNVNTGSDHSDDERVVDSGILEERRSVVEDEVDTSELLKGLKSATSEKALSQVTAEAVEVGGLAKRQLVLVVGSDLSQLLNESGVLNIKAAKSGKRLSSLLGAALLDEPARSLRKPDATDEENDGPGELNSDGDTVRAGIIPILGGVVDDSSKQETDGNSELVTADNGTTNPLGGSLGLIEGDGGTDHTDAVASEETSSNEHGDSGSNGLEDNTYTEDDVADNETQAATKEIGGRRGSKSTEEGTSR